MSQSGESGSCSSTKGLECSTVGASVMCELQVKVSGDSAHWHTECHYWPANCPSLTATLQKAKDIIIPYLNSSFQINISFPSFTSNLCNNSYCRLTKMAILIIAVLLLRTNWFASRNKWVPALHFYAVGFMGFISIVSLSLCSLALLIAQPSSASRVLLFYSKWTWNY